jgi:hypothetical protein
MTTTTLVRASNNVSRGIFGLILLLGLTSVSVAAGKPAQQAPRKSAQELLTAHQANWDAIQTVEMIFDHHFLWIQKGIEHVNQKSCGNTWIKSGVRERLKRMHYSEPGSLMFIDHYFDGQMQSHTTRNGQIDAANGGIKFLSSDHYRQTGQTTDPFCTLQLLRTVPILTRFKSAQLSLAELFATWKITVGDKRIVESEELWPVHAEYPSHDKNDKFTGSKIDLLINANRGHLIQRVDFICRHTGMINNGREEAVCYTAEVLEFKTCRNGVHFPRAITYDLRGDPDIPLPKNEVYKFSQGWTATQLNVNFPVPAQTISFRFPEGSVVNERLADNKSGRVFVWGANNLPAREFASEHLYYQSLDHDSWESMGTAWLKSLAKPAVTVPPKIARPVGN